MMVQVDADELAALRAENKRLTARVDELLASNTATVEARRYDNAHALGRLAAKVHGLAREKGWHSPPVTIASFVANLHGETSELWEAYRCAALDKPCDKSERMTEPLTCLEEETADILIRTLDMVAALGVDVDRAVRVKHGYNATREQRHGGKLA
jgi:hypothetical protein